MRKGSREGLFAGRCTTSPQRPADWESGVTYSYCSMRRGNKEETHPKP